MARDVRLRHSVAPRVLDGSLATRPAASNAHHSVRLAPATASGGAGSSDDSGGGPILTTFVWKEGGHRVQLAGSWDGWRKHAMTYAAAGGMHVLVVELPPAEYYYRFVVDGRWRVAEGDDVRRDPLGEMSHVVDVRDDASPHKGANRKSVAVARAGALGKRHSTVIDEGASDTESEASDVTPPLPRQRHAALVQDYDDDANGEFDLQADVFEAMRDVAEKTDIPAHVSPVKSPQQAKRRKKPGRRMMARIMAVLFAQPAPTVNDEESEAPAPPTRNQKAHALAQKARGLRVWFPSEKRASAEEEAAPGRKLDQEEKAAIIDANDTAMRLHQVEENADSRQQLGKTLFAQGKYDAALALFSLAVKLREDHGLRNARTNAVAHTDVASAFIYIGDLQNADKHLRIALDIFKKATFSGGKVQLGDVHCFLGVVGDMRGHLKDAALAYQNAIDIYERARATGSDNPNFQTAVDNLASNTRRMKQVEMAGGDPNNANPKKESPADAVLDAEVQAPPAPGNAPQGPPKRRPPRSQQAPPPPPPPANQPARGKGRVPPPPPPPSSAPPAQQQVALSARQPTPMPPARRSGDAPKPPTRAPRPKAPAPPPVEPKRPQHSPQPPMPSVEPEPERQSWAAIAAQARRSMPQAPPPAEASGGFEDMCRAWHAEARRLFIAGRPTEAVEQYTLAIYTRKKHGPWVTVANAKTLVEHARACIATRQLADSAASLHDAVGVYEQLGDAQLVPLGEAWSALGSILDRLGQSPEDAHQAHVAAMVALGRGGVSTDDKRWDKAWRALCSSLDLTPGAMTPEEAWDIVEAGITDIKPIS